MLSVTVAQTVSHVGVEYAFVSITQTQYYTFEWNMFSCLSNTDTISNVRVEYAFVSVSQTHYYTFE